MSEREMVPWETLIQQWEGETPLLLTDQVIGQLLQSSKETKGYIQSLSLAVAELRAEVRILKGEGQDE